MTKPRNPKTKEVAAIANDAQELVELVQALDKSEQDHDDGVWGVGRWLRENLGPVGTTRKNNGSTVAIRKFSAALKDAGCKHHSTSWLRLVWYVDCWFCVPDDKRLACADWYAHAKAKSPAILAGAVEAAREAARAAREQGVDDDDVPVHVTGSDVERFLTKRQHEEDKRPRDEAGVADGRPPVCCSRYSTSLATLSTVKTAPSTGYDSLKNMKGN